MRSRVAILLVLATAGCGGGMPQFLGRDGAADGVYTLGGDPLPDPVRMPLRQAVAEPGLHGVIIRVDSIAPTQGYYTAHLRPLNGGAIDTGGIVSFELLAYPPLTAAAVGPERTRILTAAVFMTDLTLRDVRGFRVVGVNQTATLPHR